MSQLKYRKRMANCKVKLDNNPNGIYYSGQTVSGVVEIANEKNWKLRFVSLRMEGFAKCKWSESKGSGRHRRSVSYSGREDYMNTLNYLIGNDGDNETELAVGLHKFNFSCELPFNLPTSFESKYGYIRYQITIKVVRPWKLDQKYCFGFTVIKVHNLNFDDPAIRTPFKAETTENVSLGLSSKLVYLSAEIPMRGFVAGQSIPITILANNESNIDIKAIKISLMKIIHYNSQTPKQKTRERIESTAELRHSGIQRNCKDSIVTQLVLPPVPPSNITQCSIIQVSYVIEVVAKVSGIHFNPAVRLPLTIGTVPLQNNQQTNLLNDGASTSSTAVSASTALQWINSKDLPPPSYQEAMAMISNDDDNDEGLTEDRPFSPLYPVVNFAVPITN